MGEIFRILPSTTGLCCPLVKSCEITLSPFPQKGQKDWFCLKAEWGEGSSQSETHNLRGKKTPELSRKYDWANWQTGTKAPLSADRSTNCLHQTVCFIPAPWHLFVHPAGVFNWNLYLQECRRCTDVILFPLFWHLEATSESPALPPGAGSSALLTLGNQQLLNYCRAAPFAGL